MGEIQHCCFHVKEKGCEVLRYLYGVRWVIYSKYPSTDLCFLQHKKNGSVFGLAGLSLPENGPSQVLPVGPSPFLSFKPTCQRQSGTIIFMNQFIDPFLSGSIRFPCSWSP